MALSETFERPLRSVSRHASVIDRKRPSAPLRTPEGSAVRRARRWQKPVTKTRIRTAGRRDPLIHLRDGLTAQSAAIGPFCARRFSCFCLRRAASEGPVAKVSGELRESCAAERYIGTNHQRRRELLARRHAQRAPGPLHGAAAKRALNSPAGTAGDLCTLPLRRRACCRGWHRPRLVLAENGSTAAAADPPRLQGRRRRANASVVLPRLNRRRQDVERSLPSHHTYTSKTQFLRRPPPW